MRVHAIGCMRGRGEEEGFIYKGQTRQVLARGVGGGGGEEQCIYRPHLNGSCYGVALVSRID